MQKTQMIRAALVANPNANVYLLANKANVAPSYVYKLRHDLTNKSVVIKPPLEMSVSETIRRVKDLAKQVGGLKTLASLIEAIQ